MDGGHGFGSLKGVDVDLGCAI